MKIIVDADACPKAVLQMCFQAGHNYHIPVWTVASFNHNILSDHHIVVESHSQAADIKIINITEKGDLIITQDWGLAAMVLGREAKCLSPDGREYLPDKIEFLLEAREIKAKHRRSGGRTKGPKKRTSEDDAIFAASMGRILAGVHSVDSSQGR